MTVVHSQPPESSMPHIMFSDETFDIGKQVFHNRDQYIGYFPNASGKLRDYENSQFFFKTLAMEKPLDIEEIRARIEAEMKAKGFSAFRLSTKAGLSPTAVRDILQRVDNPGIGTLHKIAEALDTSFDNLTRGSHVPLMGKIGAGGEIIMFQDDCHEFEMVERPPLTFGPVMALQVSGDSMLPKYESGDIVYVRREHDGILPQYMGVHCAVHLADGGTYLKILSAGTAVNRYTLRSLNAADMENVEVIWASPVLFIMPRSARVQSVPAPALPETN